MLSNCVFKIGSGIKGDMTRLKKQFSQLSGKPITTIDLKDYAIQRGVIHQKDSGSLDALVEKTLERYLSKEDVVWKSECWEDGKLSSDLIQYAATDVFASHCIFEKLSESPLLNNITIDTPAGSRIALLIQEGGEIIAYGKISADQSSPFKGVRVKVPNRNCIVIDIDTLLKPSAVAVLHIDHSISNSTASKNGRTKLGAFTLGQLQEASMSSSFSMVTPTSLLIFDNRNVVCYSDIIVFYLCSLNISMTLRPWSLLSIHRNLCHLWNLFFHLIQNLDWNLTVRNQMINHILNGFRRTSQASQVIWQHRCCKPIMKHQLYLEV